MSTKERKTVNAIVADLAAQEKEKNATDPNVGGMSDASIEQGQQENEPVAADEPTVKPADDIPVTVAKGFIYRPLRVQDDILKKASDATGLSSSDVISVALLLLGNATLPELRLAIQEHSGNKAEALLSALKAE